MDGLPTFQILAAPKHLPGTESEPIPHAIAQKFRDLRLKALQIAPEAFAATYESERLRSLQQTFDRLSNPKAVSFVAVKSKTSLDGSVSDGTGLNDLLEGQWVGFGGLVGDALLEGSHVAETKSDSRVLVIGGELKGADGTAANEPLYFHLTGMFVEPYARRRGLGKALIDAAIGRAREEARKSDVGVRVTIDVNSGNREAKQLYEKAGFQVFGEMTYFQRFVTDSGEEGVRERVALQMEIFFPVLE